MVFLVVFIILVVLAVVLFKDRILNSAAESYAKVLLKDPKFLEAKDKVEASYAEYNTKKAKILVEAAEAIIEDPAMQWLQKAINEMQDVDKGIALHELRCKMVELYNVDWETAAESVKVGLANGALKIRELGPDEYDIVKLLFNVKETE